MPNAQVLTIASNRHTGPKHVAADPSCDTATAATEPGPQARDIGVQVGLGNF